MSNKIILNREAELEILNSKEDLNIEEFEFDSKGINLIFFDPIDFLNTSFNLKIEISINDKEINKNLYREYKIKK